MGVDSVWVDEGELGEGLLPAGGDLAFDEVSFCFAFGAAAEAGFLGAVAGPFVLDGADGQPQQFDHRVVVGEVAAVFDDLAELVVQRFDAVGGIDHPAQHRRERQKRGETLPRVVEGGDGVGVPAAQLGGFERLQLDRAASASAAW